LRKILIAAIFNGKQHQWEEPMVVRKKKKAVKKKAVKRTVKKAAKKKPAKKKSAKRKASAKKSTGMFSMQQQQLEE